MYSTIIYFQKIIEVKVNKKYNFTVIRMDFKYSLENNSVSLMQFPILVCLVDVFQKIHSFSEQIYMIPVCLLKASEEKKKKKDSE